jgi:hypothetical protein
MRVITALAVVIVNVGLGWVGASASAAPDGIGPGPISQCYTVTISPPTQIKPSVTVCQP